jgi:D-arabinitol 4-dehydrogenase
MDLQSQASSNLSKILESNFDKKKLHAGILHIGVGNFHRSHQAYLIDQLIEKKSKYNWGIIGLNLIKSGEKDLKSLQHQEGNYVLKTISSKGDTKYRKIKSIVGLLDWNLEKEKSEQILTNKDIHLVTITVTETGYFLNEDSKLDQNHVIIKNEIDNLNTTSIYSYLRTALNQRMHKINQPITILCCDNLRENGKILENAFIKYLELLNDTVLLEWIAKNVSFPSCVVDRITPRVPATLSGEIENNFKIKKNCSVLSEDFIQWVIEEKFSAPFPDIDELESVNITKNVIPYEETKIRVLNGGHSCLAYLGALMGLKTFDECFKKKNLDSFFYDLEIKEIIPSLGNDIPFDLTKYLNTIYERFQNSNISDALERICMDGSSKFPIFVLPTIKKCFEMNIEPINGITAIASWYVFMKKINNKELSFDYIDPKWVWLKNFLKEDKIDDFCSNKDLWGELPETFPRFKEILRLRIDEKKFWKDLNG